MTPSGTVPLCIHGCIRLSPRWGLGCSSPDKQDKGLSHCASPAISLVTVSGGTLDRDPRESAQDFDQTRAVSRGCLLSGRKILRLRVALATSFAPDDTLAYQCLHINVGPAYKTVQTRRPHLTHFKPRPVRLEMNRRKQEGNGPKCQKHVAGVRVYLASVTSAVKDTLYMCMMTIVFPPSR